VTRMNQSIASKESERRDAYVRQVESARCAVEYVCVCAVRAKAASKRNACVCGDARCVRREKEKCVCVYLCALCARRECVVCLRAVCAERSMRREEEEMVRSK